MIDTTDFSAAFKEKLAQVELEFEQKLAEVIAARQAVEEAEGASFWADMRHQHFLATVLNAARGTIEMGQIDGEPRMLTLVAPALDQIAFEELRLKQSADIASTRARKLLANLEWELSNISDGVRQLRRCVNPPPLAAPRLEVVPRPERAVDFDDIEMPPAARGAA